MYYLMTHFIYSYMMDKKPTKQTTTPYKQQVNKLRARTMKKQTIVAKHVTN